MSDNWDRAIRMEARDRAPQIGRAVTNKSFGVGGANDLVLNAEIEHGSVAQRDCALLEILYSKFWAAGKVVDLKPDDALSTGLVWTDDDQDKVEAIKEEMKRLKAWKRLRQAVKASRIYGTALLILAPRSGNFLEPIIEDQVRAGDISHLLVVDRFRLEDHVVEGNPANPLFGHTLVYRWNYCPPSGTYVREDVVPESQIDIHHSRTIRLDCVAPPTDDGWQSSGDDRWGQSVLVRAIEDIVQDKVLNAAMVQVVRRACVPIIQMERFKEMIGRGKTSAKEANANDYAKDINERLNLDSLLFLDTKDKVAKLDMSTTGIMDVVKQQSERMAMIEGIPITRFTGQSASGLSATGEGDAKDWRITIEGYREQYIEEHVERLLGILARSAGLKELPDWEWGRLGEVSEQDTADVAKSYAETTAALVEKGIIDEDEARQVLNQSELFDLDEDYEPPAPLETRPVGDPKNP